LGGAREGGDVGNGEAEQDFGEDFFGELADGAALRG
jgi:hypothetical protein